MFCIYETAGIQCQYNFPFDIKDLYIMSKKASCFLLVLFALLLPLGVGCSKNVKISGKVMLEDGSPVSNGTILFQAATTQSYGEIQKDGSYYLSTLKDGDGVLPGTYKVVVTGTSKPSSRKTTDVMDTGEEPMVDMIYSEYELTPLSQTVTKKETIDFKLKPFSGYIKKAL
jgi:hypothetical protein